MMSLAAPSGVSARSTALISGESLLIGTSVWLTVGLPHGSSHYAPAASAAVAAMVVTLVCQACNYYRDLYDFRLLGNPLEVWRRILQSLGIAAAVLALARVLSPLAFIPADGLVLALLVLGLVIPAWRVGFEWFSRHVWPSERLLLLGVTAPAVDFARELTLSGHRGVDVVGFVEVGRETSAIAAVPILGGLEDIPAIVRARGIDKVVVSLADARGQLPMQKLLDMRLDGVMFEHLATIYEAYMGRIAVEDLRPSWLIFSPGFRKGRLLRASKRAADIAGAAIGILLTLPLMIVIAIAVKWTSPGPILYRQLRVGQYGRVFAIRKFRSMRQDAEVGTGAVWAVQNDPRVSPIGRWLRRLRLDELPQLWNVFIGDMSLVGPRPERPEFVKSLTRDITFYGQRHVVRPGLTGWAQVCYTYGATVEDALKKLQYDLYYIKNMSLILDLIVALRTIKVVTLGRGAC